MDDVAYGQPLAVNGHGSVATRLIDKAKPGQILIAEFVREIDDTDKTMRTPEFLAAANRMLGGLAGTESMGLRLKEVVIALTGTQQTDAGARLQRLRVSDKHGLAHYCYNARVTVVPESGEGLACGLRHEELPGAASTASPANGSNTGD